MGAVRHASARIVAGVFVLLAVTGTRVPAETRQAVTGLVVSVDEGLTGFVVSHDAIPGVMPAMTMPFEVRDARELSGVVPGVMVTLTLVLSDQGAHAERVRVQRYQSIEQDPLAATRLTILREAARARSAAASSVLTTGALVPDFVLVDQIDNALDVALTNGLVEQNPVHSEV